ncbi:hypothetical protein BYT27DRAFT_7209403 [Phlegmacium glaucopus]|nr:hypothetical protein BYT27DRAFT_7209403 [Phlegmacium glaucopus]
MTKRKRLPTHKITRATREGNKLALMTNTPLGEFDKASLSHRVSFSSMQWSVFDSMPGSLLFCMVGRAGRWWAGTLVSFANEMRFGADRVTGWDGVRAIRTRIRITIHVRTERVQLSIRRKDSRRPWTVSEGTSQVWMRVGGKISTPVFHNGRDLSVMVLRFEYIDDEQEAYQKEQFPVWLDNQHASATSFRLFSNRERMHLMWKEVQQYNGEQDQITLLRTYRVETGQSWYGGVLNETLRL